MRISQTFDDIKQCKQLFIKETQTKLYEIFLPAMELYV